MKDNTINMATSHKNSVTNTYKVVSFAFTIFTILICIIANEGLGNHFWGFLEKVPGGDKYMHFILVGIFAFLLNPALSSKTFRISFIVIYKGSFYAILFITIEEFTQIFNVNRTFCMIDLLCSYLGVLFFSFVTFITNKYS